MLKPFSSNIPPGWEWDCRSSKLAPSPRIPNLCNRWLPWNLILRYNVSQLTSDIEIHTSRHQCSCHGIRYWDTMYRIHASWHQCYIEIHASWYWDTCQLILRYMPADINVYVFFPGQPLKDDVGKCVEAALKKYDEQKNVVWISLRWQLHDIWYFIYIFSLIILVWGDLHYIWYFIFIFSMIILVFIGDLHDIWYFIYIFSMIILVLGDHHDISFIFSLWLF